MSVNPFWFSSKEKTMDDFTRALSVAFEPNTLTAGEPI
jgi:hypothetical protein